MGIISWFGLVLLSKILQFLTAPVSAPVLLYVLSKKRNINAKILDSTLLFSLSSFMSFGLF